LHDIEICISYMILHLILFREKSKTQVGCRKC